MKVINNIYYTSLNSEQLQNLTTLVPETIAIDVAGFNKKSFTSADLWNIQRAKKSVRNRRSL